MRDMRNHFCYSSRNEKYGELNISFPGEWGSRISKNPRGWGSSSSSSLESLTVNKYYNNFWKKSLEYSFSFRLCTFRWNFTFRLCEKAKKIWKEIPTLFWRCYIFFQKVWYCSTFVAFSHYLNFINKTDFTLVLFLWPSIPA